MDEKSKDQALQSGQHQIKLRISTLRFDSFKA